MEEKERVLLWLDLETTGLDPATDKVLEIAWGFADFNNPFDVPQWSNFTLRSSVDYTQWNNHIDPVVTEMHLRNGLFKECWEIGSRRVEPVSMLLLANLAMVANEEVILAGSCPWFDREFLQAQLGIVPRKHLSHRMYDVSAIKLFCQSLGMPKFPKGEAHRALPDVQESVDHARKCASWLAGYVQ